MHGNCAHCGWEGMGEGFIVLHQRQYEKSQGKCVCDESSKTLVFVTERKFVGDNSLNHMVWWFECHPKAFHLI